MCRCHPEDRLRPPDSRPERVPVLGHHLHIRWALDPYRRGRFGVSSAGAGTRSPANRWHRPAHRISRSDHHHPQPDQLARLIGVPLFLYLFLGARADVAAIVVLAVGGTSDWVDGYIARRLRQVSRLGELLDPLADRLYILATLLAFTVREVVPWQFTVALLAREVLLAGCLLVLRRHGYGPPPVHYVGKTATFMLLAAFPVLLLAAAVPGPPRWRARRLGPGLVGSGAVLGRPARSILVIRSSGAWRCRVAAPWRAVCRGDRTSRDTASRRPHVHAGFPDRVVPQPARSGYADAAARRRASGPACPGGDVRGPGVTVLVLVLAWVSCWPWRTGRRWPTSRAAARPGGAGDSDQGTRGGERDRLSAQADTLRQEVARQRDAAVATGGGAPLRDLEAVTGLGRVRGDGVVVRVTDAPATSDAVTGRAVAEPGPGVGPGPAGCGERVVGLGRRGGVDQRAAVDGDVDHPGGGQHILVDFRPVASPYEVSAVGPDRMARTGSRPAARRPTLRAVSSRVRPGFRGAQSPTVWLCRRRTSRSCATRASRGVRDARRAGASSTPRPRVVRSFFLPLPEAADDRCPGVARRCVAGCRVRAHRAAGAAAVPADRGGRGVGRRVRWGSGASWTGIFDDKQFVVSFISNVLVAGIIVYLGDQLGCRVGSCPRGSWWCSGCGSSAMWRLFAGTCSGRRFGAMSAGVAGDGSGWPAGGPAGGPIRGRRRGRTRRSRGRGRVSAGGDAEEPAPWVAGPGWSRIR